MKFIFLFLFFIPHIVICQVEPFRDEDYYKMEIDKNIFRGMMTFLLQSQLRFTACYGREIKKPFTLVLKAGPSILSDNVSSDSEIELSAIASGELRYYFNLHRRIKHKKTVRNFSAAYFSLEPFVVSKPLILFDEPGNDEKPGKAGVYINIGFQGQFKRTYFSAYFGTPFFGEIYSNSVDLFDIIQAAIVIGRVF